MNSLHQERADRIVDLFRTSLDQSIREQITDNQFQVLSSMISEAIGEELEIAAEQMAEVVRKLRAQSGKAEIGL